MSVFAQIVQDKTADEVAHQVEALILEGVLTSGDQLPPERELAAEIGVSRPVLREAIELLETRKILHRRQGDGTFVSDIIGQVFSEPIAALLPHHRKATVDYLEYRREIEGVSAAFAAERATRFDLTMLEKTMAQMAAAHEAADFEAEALVDVAFHSLIGEMAHNLVLLHTLRSCYRLLSEGVFRNRDRLYETEGGREALYRQHQKIAAAVTARDADKARQAARDHITYVLEKSARLEEEIERERIAGLRFRHRGG